MIFSTSMMTSLSNTASGSLGSCATPRPPAPTLALRRIGSSADIFVSLFVGRDQPHLGAEFDRKIADGQPPFDRHIADRAAGIFDGVAGTAGRADMADQRQDEVLGGDAEGQSALELHPHGLRPALDDRLVASTWVSSLDPIPKASAPRPPCVQVWLSPQTIGQAGRLRPSSGPMTWTMPWPGSPISNIAMPLADVSARKGRQQLLPDLDRAGPPMRRRNGMVRGGERQFRIVNPNLRLLRSSKPRDPPRSCNK